MDSYKFRFKRFDVSHEKSTMKVGVDAVLLGAWINKDINAINILDVGTGCGVIALIMAQNFPKATITAIDIDCGSIEEAEFNFKNSIWSDRLNAILQEFPFSLHNKNIRKYDLIVSNPPFFKSGIRSPETKREKARHQAGLSVFSLIENARELLTENGRIAVIFPTDYLIEVEEKIDKEDMRLIRKCLIRNKDTKPYKRVMMEIGFRENSNEVTKIEELTMFHEDKPTLRYTELCRDLYLKF